MLVQRLDEAESRCEVYERIGVNRSTVSRWLRPDSRRRPSLAVALRIEAELGIAASLWFA